ncbi:MAG: indole-3-glycerol phosphate synthase TrpC [Chloroflexi bacterium AL-W]|nr:indole-3-glycerol phosphate synthase TrpC [Chloroflexi bacterium AL-W]
MSYVKTDTILDKILAKKVEEVAASKIKNPINRVLNFAKVACVPRDFAAVLNKPEVALIAEVKKASPSKGVLITDFDPVQLGITYAENGASAISVLTDEAFFQGHMDYLTNVRGRVKVPTLRKDFIIDPYQVIEARAADADAVLLIVAALDDVQLSELHQTITENNMTPLVEVHNEQELERALKVHARVIGVNNRDLKTFTVDLTTTARIAPLLPPDVILVAESGIHTVDDVRQMGALGAHAVLVGEGLVKSADIAQAVREFSQQPRNPQSPPIN